MASLKLYGERFIAQEIIEFMKTVAEKKVIKKTYHQNPIQKQEWGYHFHQWQWDLQKIMIYTVYINLIYINININVYTSANM